IGTCNSTAEVNNNPNYLPSLPYTTSLETGMGNFISAANGDIANLVNGTSFNMEDTTVHTPYTMSYNVTFERELSTNLVASVGYVGNMARHLYNAIDSDGAYALTNPNINFSLTFPFPSLGMLQSSFNGVSMYNSLQTKIQKRYAGGLSYLATYTWAHATDNSSNPGIGVGPGLRSPLIIPINDDVTNSSYDVRHRVTVNGLYELPFGKGKKWAHQGGVLDYLVGGWQSSLTWQAQTGTPFTITSINEWDNGTAPNGGNVYAYRIRDPFAGGGTPDATQLAAGVTSCPASVHNKTHWYNPCAFANPWNAATGPHAIPFPTVPGQPSVSDGSAVVGVQNAMNYLGGKSNQVYGPGFERVNMSAFKTFKVWREEYIQFRADAFNLLNHPSWGNPSDDTSNDSGGGDILGVQSFQNLTPDARFFQVAAKYVF
ncbi:MAG: TonB-dependent receptor, partial [Terracidiphilus sp.]